MRMEGNGKKGKGEGMIPYGRQSVDGSDIDAVAAALLSDWITTGPRIEEFERKVAAYVEADHAVAVSSGTAGLHAAMNAAGIGPGDEVIVPPMTFAATANAVLYQGGTPVFADVTPGSLLIDPERVEAAITARTKAIMAVDYAGHPCDYGRLREIADRRGLILVADGCHALGATWQGRMVGSLADMTVFSFHPVKHITTGEGGLIATRDPGLASRMRRFRNHGIDTDHRQRTETGTWRYHMESLGFNYRITDFQCALGISQLARQPEWLVRRRAIARGYRDSMGGMEGLNLLQVHADAGHAYHLFVVELDLEKLDADRDGIYQELRAGGLGVNVHYLPVHLHPYYRRHLGTREGMCPAAEDAFSRILSLPMYPGLDEADCRRVVDTVKSVVGRHLRK